MDRELVLKLTQNKPAGQFLLLMKTEIGYFKNKAKNVNMSLNVNWNIVTWLQYQFVGSIAFNLNNSESFAGEKTSYIELNYRGYAYGSESSGSAKFKAALLPFGDRKSVV